MKTIKVNQEQLRKKLIDIYSDYIIDDVKAKAIRKAMKADGLWSGSFLLSEEIETAVNSLTSMYVEPLLSKEKAKNILKKLLEMSSKNDP